MLPRLRPAPSLHSVGWPANRAVAPALRGVVRRSPSRAVRCSASAKQQQESPSTEQTGDDGRELLLALATVGLCGALGTGLGAAGAGLDPALPTSTQAASAGLGWSYFAAWSFSFYPQVYDNWRRKSADGLSADYLVFSIIGYAAYTAYTAALYFSPGVQAAYEAAHGGSLPDVSVTDVLFASQALAVSLITLCQMWLYRPSGSSSSSSSSNPLGLSPGAQWSALGLAGVVAVYCGHVSSTCGVAQCDAWLPLLSFLGAVKVAVTLIKYTPQAALNHSRRSTQGWSVANVLLDLAGGVLSFGQVGLNAAARADATVITGNPAKLGIAAVSIAFDLLFVAQHYWLYRQPGGAGGSEGSSARSHGQSSSSSDAGTQPLPVAVEAAPLRRGLGRGSQLARRAASAAAEAAGLATAAGSASRSRAERGQAQPGSRGRGRLQE